MESTMEDHSGTVSTQSLQSAWRHFKQIWAATSASDAWQSFKYTIEALPVWAIVLLVVAFFVVVANTSHLAIPLAIAGSLAAIFFTVKLAVLAALKQHDSTKQKSAEEERNLL